MVTKPHSWFPPAPTFLIVGYPLALSCAAEEMAKKVTYMNMTEFSRHFNYGRSSICTLAESAFKDAKSEPTGMASTRLLPGRPQLGQLRAQLGCVAL